MTASVLFSPQTKHLIGCVRAAIGTAEWPTRPNIDWREFLELIDRHRLGAFLYVHRPRSDPPPWPEGVEERLSAIATAALRRAMNQAVAQYRLARLLESAGIATLVVKGIVLSQELYGGLGRRHVGDIDLLIQPHDAEAADSLLQKYGLRRTRPDFQLTPRQFREYLRIKPEFEYVQPGKRRRVELLWRAEGLPIVNEILPRAKVVRLGDHAFLTLPPDLNALYLFQHGARHGWFRLFWLVDVALLLRSKATEMNWNDVLAQARFSGTERSLFQGAALVAELLGCSIPEPLQCDSKNRATVDSLGLAAKREIVRASTSAESTVLWARRVAYRVRLQNRLARKFRTLAPHLFSPESWRMWRLPDSFFFLYYPATPILWLWRRFRLPAKPPIGSD